MKKKKGGGIKGGSADEGGELGEEALLLVALLDVDLLHEQTRLNERRFEIVSL